MKKCLIYLLCINIFCLSFLMKRHNVSATGSNDCLLPVPAGISCLQCAGASNTDCPQPCTNSCNGHFTIGYAHYSCITFGPIYSWCYYDEEEVDELWGKKWICACSDLDHRCQGPVWGNGSGSSECNEYLTSSALCGPYDTYHKPAVGVPCGI